MSGLNCELYRRCLSSAMGSVFTGAVPPCILASSCSARCLSCCSRWIRSARSCSIVLLPTCFPPSLLCRWCLWWCEPCTVVHAFAILYQHTNSQVSSRNSNTFPRVRASSNKGGCRKQASFLALCVNISKTVWCEVTVNTLIGKPRFTRD